MKNVFLFFIISLFFLTSCSNADKTKTEENDKLNVYTSFHAVYDFTSKIGGDKINLSCLVPSGSQPHDWEPSVKDMLELENTDIFFYNGAGMENFIEKIKKSIDSNNLKYVELSTAAELIKNENDINDPHVWLNPRNVIKEMEMIKNTLSKYDSDNASYYEKNFNEHKEKLEKLDTDFLNAVSKFKTKNIITSHEAYGYLCDAYGLNQVGIEGLMAESEPSPSKMAEITEYIKTNNIKYIFYEELLNPKTTQIISDETGCQLLELSAFEGLTKEQSDNEYDYYLVMYKNLDNLKKALGE